MASCEELPAVQIFESREYAEVDWGKLLMEFRLIYQGPLLAASDKDARLAHKHEIRKKIHAQLAELWQAHPFLNELSRTWPDHSSGKEARRSKLDGLADQNIVNGIRFAPLVSQYYGLICSLDILFLRRGAEGNLIQTGDLDNRLKTLLDSLRKPSAKELPSDIEAANEPNPFFCLLQDDSLVTQLRITADRLLVPQRDADSEIITTEAGEKGSKHPENKVYLVIEARTMIIDSERAYAEFGMHK